MDATKGYVNPVPAIDAGKKFELRLMLNYDELIPVDTAKRRVAEFIKDQDVNILAGWIQCVEVHALYPSDLTDRELKSLGAPDRAADRAGSAPASQSDAALLAMLRQYCARTRESGLPGCRGTDIPCTGCPVDDLMSRLSASLKGGAGA